MNRVRIDNRVLDYILVISIGLVVTYLGSFIASRRIKRVSTRELVSEQRKLKYINHMRLVDN